MTKHHLKVAVPWSLSHYIPMNGFHPLYRALFDHSPANVELHAWDNVKLSNRFARDLAIRTAILDAAKAANNVSRDLDAGSIARRHQEYFWPPNQVLTNELHGDIEFHHTAPFPTLGRPFVFHCESFAPIFLPFVQQGSGEMEKHQNLRDHYHRIFANPLCLGIFSHVPETLESMRRFFSSPDIDSKLFDSRIGLSANAAHEPGLPEKAPISRPIFLFVNSAHQNPANFFRRGGHIVLRFWKEFKATGRDGLLMLRCARPSEKDLSDCSVDTRFVNTETGRSILWAEDYLANHEMNALMASAHFFLLPSASLHSASILQAMTWGTIPIVTDTIGTSVYISDDQHGIVLSGVRDALWRTDPNTGVMVDCYRSTPDLDDSLATQLTSRVVTLLDAPDAYLRMRQNTMAHAERQFSGEGFSSQFWDAVSDLHQNYIRSSIYQPIPNKVAPSLHDCTLKGDGWSRVFESPTQPMRKIYTGQSIVWELGGAIMHAHGNPPMELNDWSVLAQYYSPGAAQTTFSTTIDELGGKYLSFAGTTGETRGRRLTGLISRALMPFPELHSYAASALKKIRLYRRFLEFSFSRSSLAPDVELVLHQVSGYNVIRYFHKFYAIPQSEGEFIPTKATAGGYSSCFSGKSVDQILKKIAEGSRQSFQPARTIAVTLQPELTVEGFHGFNIIRLGDEYHAILQSEGAFELARLASGQYSVSFSGRVIVEIKCAIMASVNSERQLGAEHNSATNVQPGT